MNSTSKDLAIILCKSGDEDLIFLEHAFMGIKGICKRKTRIFYVRKKHFKKSNAYECT